MRSYKGQGATEYLVLLAVVLIVALVSVALIGFFPGMASDAQRTQSETYWRSASPIAITEMAAKTQIDNIATYPYFRLGNNGAYPIRITALIGGDGNRTTTVVATGCGANYPPDANISDLYHLAPGEEKYFGVGWMYNLACHRQIHTFVGATSSGHQLGGATSGCQNSTSSPGILQFNSVGFEYIQYMDNNQQITKRQIGAKPIIVKCMPPA